MSGGKGINRYIKRPDNEIIINKVSDFKLEPGGEHKLVGNTVYKFGVSALFGVPNFDIDGLDGTVIFEGNVNMFYFGVVDDMFSGTAAANGVVEIKNTLLAGNSSVNCFDCTGAGTGALTVFILTNSTVTAFKGVGVIRDFFGGQVIRGSQFLSNESGLSIGGDCNFLSIDVPNTANLVDSNSPHYSIDGSIGSASVMGASLTVQAGESTIQLSSDISVNKMNVSGFSYSNSLGGEFLATAKTGSITAFADNGSGGTTVTSAAHGMTIERKETTSGTTNYNGIHTVSNITTNTYDIDVAFVADDATGSFTTGDSNDFLDSNSFEFRNNGDQKSSNEIAEMGDALPFVVTIASAGVPVEAAGTTGDWVSVIDRRWSFEADGSGTFRYTGTKTQEFRVAAIVDVSVVSGGAKLMAAYIAKNGSILINSRDEAESNREIGLGPGAIVEMSTGDYLSIFIENEDDTTNINVLSGSMDAFAI